MQFRVLTLTLDAEDVWTAGVTDVEGGGRWFFPVSELEPMFYDHQRALAEWMGYPTLRQMNADHDKFHEWLADWMSDSSRSLAVARGEKLSERDYMLACLEEEAVLHLQRFVAHVNARK
jgi:hypothetical protein